MPKGQDLSRHQERIVNRYYEHKDTIVAARLAEIVSDLFIVQADGDDAAAKRKATALWKRAATALKQTKLPPSAWEPIVEARDATKLAALANRLAG